MDVSSAYRLFSIFKEKSWVDNSYSENAFLALCHLMANINVEQQELILQLLGRYEWVKFAQFEAIVINLTTYLESLCDGVDNFYIGPVLKIDDHGKLKSGHGATYLIGSMTPRAKKLKNAKPQFITDYSTLKLGTNDLLVIVDDYMGSGDTVIGTIEELTTTYGLPLDQITVVLIASQEVALEKLKALNIKHYTYMSMKRGISDHYSDDVLVSTKETMKTMEKLLPTLRKKYSFGYKETEALFTINDKTPNNTFPIFWLSHKIKDELYEPAFPR